MGAGASTPEVVSPSPLERRVSTVSARAMVQTNAVEAVRKSSNWTVQKAGANTRLGFQAYQQNDENDDSPTQKVPQISEVLMFEQVFPKISDISRMTTNELSTPRVPVGVPTNYMFESIGGHAGAIRCLSCSVDGSQSSIAVDGKGTCAIVDCTTGDLIMNIRGSEPVLCCAITRDAKFVIVTTRESTTVFDLNNGKRVRDIIQAQLVAVSDDCDAILVCLADCTIHVFDGRGSDEIVCFAEHTSMVTAIALSRKGQKVVSGGANGEVLVWHYPSGSLKSTLSFHSGAIRGVGFSTDGSRLISADGDGIVVWDTFTNMKIVVRNSKGTILQGPNSSFSSDQQSRITACSFLAGNVVAVATSNKTVVVFEPNCGRELLVIPTKSPVCSFATNWNSDIAILGDQFGNVYKLHLNFGTRDIKVFDLHSKPQSQEKSKYD
ncbi:WD40 repeat-containing protein, putative [Bodo saltans]|uniref:WD40 repeat-containing protein, putative n=1 Tax=Bodo saltans TaxID=75058 RepID=A0A0S4JN21_BODSA|nr:WD40 repeat-containing protein, putative [Bodo saltans]|eukprot:CUG92875.1 WD40 repeat-containing protein, putative [Bodo saltans]